MKLFITCLTAITGLLLLALSCNAGIDIISKDANQAFSHLPEGHFVATIFERLVLNSTNYIHAHGLAFDIFLSLIAAIAALSSVGLILIAKSINQSPSARYLAMSLFCVALCCIWFISPTNEINTQIRLLGDSISALAILISVWSQVKLWDNYPTQYTLKIAEKNIEKLQNAQRAIVKSGVWKIMRRSAVDRSLLVRHP